MTIHSDKQSMIYYAQSGRGGPIKIGHSGIGLLRRLALLQIGNPAKLTLLAIEPGGRQRERELHDRFASNELPGEWFKPTSELMGHIASLGPLPAELKSERPVRSAKRMPLREARKIWLDLSLSQDQALLRMWGWHFRSATDVLGSRRPHLTGSTHQERQAQAMKQKRKNYLANRMPIAEARKIWHNNSDWTNAECLAEMPGWSEPMAYRELKKRKLAKGRPRKPKT